MEGDVSKKVEMAHCFGEDKFTEIYSIQMSAILSALPPYIV